MENIKISKFIKPGICSVLIPTALGLISGDTRSEIAIEVAKEGLKNTIKSIGDYVEGKIEVYNLGKFFKDELSKELIKSYGDNSFYIIEIFENSCGRFVCDGRFVDEENFCRILREEIKKNYKGGIELEEGIEGEIYQIVINKFKALSKDIAKGDTKAFQREVIDKLEEFEKYGIKIDEIYKILIKVRIPTVENKLKWNEARESELFRHSGPEWVDFKNEYVVERKEVNEIIEKFKKQKINIIKGNPASGKTVILRSIGYKLANDGKDVYILELKGEPMKIEEILKLKDLAIKSNSETYLLIDDAHLNLSYVNEIIEGLEGVNILISTRNINFDERIGPTSYITIDRYFKSSEHVLEVESVNARNTIIKKFEEIERIKIPDETKQKLSGKSLWILAWQLKTYKEHKNINEESFYKTVKNYIKTIDHGKQDLKVEMPENILLPLSLFYRHEIRVREKFLKELFKEDIYRLTLEKDIENLIKLNEINRITENNYLTLNHSEIANVYFETFEYFSELCDYVKGRIEKEKYDVSTSEKLEYALFDSYVKKFSIEVLGVITDLSKKSMGLNAVGEFMRNADLSRKSTYHLMYTLFENNKDEVLQRIKLEKDIEKIGEFITYGPLILIYFIERELNRDENTHFINLIDIKNLVKKIDEEKNIHKIKLLISSFSNVCPDKCVEIIDLIDTNNLAKKIDEEKDFNKIRSFIIIISMAHPNKCREIVKNSNLKDTKRVIIEEYISSFEKLFEKLVDDTKKSIEEKEKNNKKYELNKK